MRVLLVGPAPPPYGGMALQAQQLQKLLRADGVQAEVFASNFALPSAIRLLEHVPVVRTCLRAGLVCFRLAPRVRQVDVVHILAASWLYFFLTVYPAVLLGRAYGKRVVLNYRGGGAQAFFRRSGWLAAPVFRLSALVTAPSEFLATMIRHRFDVPVSIVPNILDHSLFEYRQRTTFRPRMLVTRRLEKIYDVASVLKAFRAVQERYADASLWIAGSGGEEAHLRSLASAWSLRNVRFLGDVAHKDLAAVYRECDIYVNASLVDNFPGGLLEASAAGLVIVTTGAGGIPFIYENGRTAWVVEPGDWRGLAQAIETVLESPARASDMTRAAAAVVRACDWTEVRKPLFEAYGFSVDALPTAPAGLNGARCAAG